jgi:flagellar biosynthetic protein FliR
MADLPFQATAFLLLFARVGAVVMLLPAFSDDGIPGQIRLMLAIGLTFGLYGLLGLPPPSSPRCWSASRWG